MRLFLRVDTQWRYAGDPPGHTGLDMAAVVAVAKAIGIAKRDRPDVLSRLRVIEAEALSQLARRRSAEIRRIHRNQKAQAAAARGRR